MTDCFSRKLNLLQIYENKLLLLDIPATFQLLYYLCIPNFELATILISNFDLLIMKNTIHLG